MQTVNKIYTINYEQPQEYRFSLDSIFLAQSVFNAIQNKISPTSNILDLCSGCGVVGLELFFHLIKNKTQPPASIDFLEIQQIYNSYFYNNLQRMKDVLNSQLNSNLFNKNYTELLTDSNFAKKYDFIVCNPPYFLTEQGKLSTSEFKNKCRFYIDSDFFHLLKTVAHCLKPTGEAYVLIHSLHNHDMNLLADSRIQTLSLNFEKIESIRKTDLYKITHL